MDKVRRGSAVAAIIVVIVAACAALLPSAPAAAVGAAQINVTITNPGSYTVGLFNTDPEGAAPYRSVDDVSGSTSLQGLPAGTYYLAVSDPSGALMTRWSGNQNDPAAAIGITLGAASTANRALTLQTPVSITGTVIDSEGPVGAVTVQAYSASTGLFAKSTKTNATGDYAIKGLPAGAYELVARDTSGDHPVVSYGRSGVVTDPWDVVVSGGNPQTFDMELPRAATMTGTVTGGASGTTALAGAKVTLYRSGVAVKTYVADADGVYTATGLAAGEYAVLFVAAGHRTEYNLDATKKADADAVTVEAGDTTTVDATLSPV